MDILGLALPHALTALNVHAPVDGNIHLMGAVATPARKERQLRLQVGNRTT